MCDLKTGLTCYAIVMIVFTGFLLLEQVLAGWATNIFLVGFVIATAFHLFMHFVLLDGVTKGRRDLLRVYMIYVLVHLVLTVIGLFLKIIIISHINFRSNSKFDDGEEEEIRFAIYVKIFIREAVNIIGDLLVFYNVRVYYESLPPDQEHVL
ncbi:uncharacterized protein LOC135397610 [Ornithodoros turicata]|uniref:uncharacterized protein LOC135397610 n=1 Tax=Ornithodoros turicata TaxID=34597 RepID=UPI00313879B3